MLYEDSSSTNAFLGSPVLIACLIRQRLTATIYYNAETLPLLGEVELRHFPYQKLRAG